MGKMKIDQGKIVEAVNSIPSVAEKESWVFTLDREEGTLFYSPKVIPSNTSLHQITDEYALYIDKNYKPKGIMVEAYDVNFIKHHKTIKKYSSSVFSGKAKVKVIDPNVSKNDNIKVLRALFENTLLKNVSTSLLST